ncbi:substrate-binding periplasmic protein [Chitinimonas sp. BJB300]|uniref:substrate-binding periplasmic protein n=1 Tax=Chitinimonas sp. BJB300 TaxID=1559339 RepID=UPI0013047A05|nr:transporter substrate-binding domain-containing protein [Chitinimonas sp. BJB300]
MRNLLLILLAFLALSSRAQQTLRVCYDNWPPYAAYDNKSGHSGITIDLIREIYGAMGLALNFQSGTQTRCLQAAHEGKIDAMLFADKETLPTWKFTTTPTEYWLVAAWVQEGSMLKRFDGLDQFAQARVGIVKNYVYPQQVGQYQNWETVEMTDPMDGLRQLSAKRIDVMFDDLIWVERVRKEQQLIIRLLEPIVEVMPQFHAVRPELAAKVAEFDREVQRRIKSGEMEKRYRSAIGLSFDAIRRNDLKNVR